MGNQRGTHHCLHADPTGSSQNASSKRGLHASHSAGEMHPEREKTEE